MFRTFLSYFKHFNCRFEINILISEIVKEKNDFLHFFVFYVAGIHKTIRVDEHRLLSHL